MQERKNIIQLLSSSNPDSAKLGWELAANFASDLLELRVFGDDVFTESRLSLVHSGLKELPKSIGQLQNLEALYLELNQLQSLPKSIGQLKKLKWILLSGNPIPKAEQERIKKLLPNCKIFF